MTTANEPDRSSIGRKPVELTMHDWANMCILIGVPVERLLCGITPDLQGVWNKMKAVMAAGGTVYSPGISKIASARWN